jgi:hypothetical protein
MRTLLSFLVVFLLSLAQSNAGAFTLDPLGRLTESLSPLGREKFAFDPASNLLDEEAMWPKTRL